MSTLWLIIRNDWRESTRSPIWHRKALINAFLILMFLYLAGNLVALGFVLDDILMKIPLDEIDYRTYKGSWVLRRLNHFLLYYFFLDFILRYFMQKLPALSIQPLLHLPISRGLLSNFMLIKTLWSPFNLVHFLIFVPFSIAMFENMAFTQAASWCLAIILLIYTNNYLLLFIKRTSDINAGVYIGLLSFFVVVFALDWLDIVDFNAVSGTIFNAFFLYPFAWIAALGTMIIAYYLNYRFLYSNMYLSKISRSKRSVVNYSGNGILSRFGLVGKLTELEFKFIWRNKRPKSVLLITILFLGYGLLVFPNPEFQDQPMMHMLFGIIITGMFILNYGQYLLGWDGTHFDHILTRNVDFQDYYMSKFVLFCIVGIGSMICAIPYVYFGWDILLMLFCVFLFNMGVNSFVVMFFGSFNPKKIDLTKGTVFNWQGVGAAQFILGFPVIGLPFLFYFAGTWLWGEQGGMLLLAGTGLLGLAGTRIWIRLLANWMSKQRYEIAKDFRNG